MTAAGAAGSQQLEKPDDVLGLVLDVVDGCREAVAGQQEGAEVDGLLRLPRDVGGEHLSAALDHVEQEEERKEVPAQKEGQQSVVWRSSLTIVRTWWWPVPRPSQPGRRSRLATASVAR